MSTFKIGELALNNCPPGRASPGCEPYRGQVVTVVSAVFTDWYGRTGYEVEANDGYRFCAAVRVLEKIPPPRDDLTLATWASVPDFRRITAPKHEEEFA